MSLVDHESKFEVEYRIEDVFNAIKDAIKKNSMFSLHGIDENINTIYLKAGVSLFSWGENIEVSCKKIDNGTEINILSTPKTGIMFGGAMDMGKNRKNITLITKAISEELKSYNKIKKVSELDEIERLYKLKEKGILTQEEFDKKKQELLNIGN